MDDRRADPYNVLWVDLFNSAAAGRNGNNQVTSIADNTNGGTLGKSDVLDGFRYTKGTNISALGAVNGTGVYLGSSTNTALSQTTRGDWATTRREPLTLWATINR